jgi:hypothetical protein
VNRCAVLGLDPGKASGIALAIPFDPEGESAAARATVVWALGAKSLDERARLIESAQSDTAEFGLELVVVGERWAGSFVKKRNTSFAIAGLGASWGEWTVLLQQAGVPKRRILRIDTGSWRTRMLGQPIRRPTAAWKLAARAYVKARWPAVELDSDDAAEAAIIAAFGLHWPKVGAVLPKRLQTFAR